MTFNGVMVVVIGMALVVWGIGLYLIHLRKKNDSAQ